MNLIRVSGFEFFVSGWKNGGGSWAQETELSFSKFLTFDFLGVGPFRLLNI